MVELKKNKEKKTYEMNPIFEIPIKISQLDQLNVRTICREIRNQVGGNQYVLLNKKGTPIRDMPNTRGEFDNNFTSNKAHSHTSNWYTLQV